MLGKISDILPIWQFLSKDLGDLKILEGLVGFVLILAIIHSDSWMELRVILQCVLGWNWKVKRHWESGTIFWEIQAVCVTKACGTAWYFFSGSRGNTPLTKRWQQNRRTSWGKLAFARFLVYSAHFLPNQMQTDICGADTCGFYMVIFCNALMQSGASINVLWEQWEHHQTVFHRSPSRTTCEDDVEATCTCNNNTHTPDSFVTTDAISIWGKVRPETKNWQSP